MAALVAAWLLLAAVACTQREQDFYDFKAVNIRGKLVSLEKYRGSVSVPGGLGAAWTGPDGGAPLPGTAGCCAEGAPAAQQHSDGSPPPRGHSLQSAAPPDPAPVGPVTTWRGPGAQ